MSYELALLEATSLELEGWLCPVIGIVTNELILGKLRVAVAPP